MTSNETTTAAIPAPTAGATASHCAHLSSTRSGNAHANLDTNADADLTMGALASATAWSLSSTHHAHPHSHLSHEAGSPVPNSSGTAPAITAGTDTDSLPMPLTPRLKSMTIADIEDIPRTCAGGGANENAGVEAAHGPALHKGYMAASPTREKGSPKKGRACPNGKSGCSCPFSQLPPPDLSQENDKSTPPAGR